MRLFLLTAGAIAALAGCTGPVGATNSAPDDLSPARKLYVAKCAKCHKLYDPMRYSDAVWQQWMTKMSPKARLKPEQEERLARYINSLRTADTNAHLIAPAPRH
jgi:hypothetical protein